MGSFLIPLYSRRAGSGYRQYLHTSSDIKRFKSGFIAKKIKVFFFEKMDFKLHAVLISILAWSEATHISEESLTQRKNHSEFCKHTKLYNVSNNWYALKEKIPILGIPVELAVHWKSRKIFFTLISQDMTMNLQVLQPSGKLETIDVPGIGQSTAVDNINNVVYLATDNGVYKYNEDGGIEPFAALGEDVMHIALGNAGAILYIAIGPQFKVHSIVHYGDIPSASLLIPNGDGLVIDLRDNKYFIDSMTAYILKSDTMRPVKIRNLPNDMQTGFFISTSYDVYAMDENSNLYLIDSESIIAEHLGSFNVTGVYTFALDSENNVIIGVKDAILKFKQFEKNPCDPCLDVKNAPKNCTLPLPTVRFMGRKPRAVKIEFQEIKPVEIEDKIHNKRKRKHKKTTTSASPPTTTPSSSELSED
ncbi:hypothetical protein NE865_07808 [Phthorimaea operculella]|nr:hypothetical protein NE865_07808 [Phthorimaea operculella]